MWHTPTILPGDKGTGQGLAEIKWIFSSYGDEVLLSDANQETAHIDFLTAHIDNDEKLTLKDESAIPKRVQCLNGFYVTTQVAYPNYSAGDKGTGQGLAEIKSIFTSYGD